MKSVLTLCAGLVLGGLILWGAQQLTGGGEEPPVVAPKLSGEPPASTMKASDPATASDSAAVSAPAAGVDGMPLVGAPLFNDREPPPVKVPVPSTPEPLVADASSDLSRIVDVSALEKERKLARATFDIGEHDRARRMLQRFYDLWKDNPSFDLTPEVQRLLRIENEYSRRRDYTEYLRKHGKIGTLFQDQLRRGIASLADSDGGKAAALAAWEDLTLAYELAGSERERRAVLDHLNPFLTRTIFSGRSTDLLTTYTVKPGDNLSSIAERFDTTVGSIRRLSGLKSTMIQPRQRLRILPGKVRVYVHKSDFRLWVSIDDRFLFEFPVGLGRDDGTPLGQFVIRVKEKEPSWWRPGEAPIPAGDPRNILGSRWLGFADTEEFSGFGIHGTTDPSSIGRASSAGCVRLREDDIELLYDFVPYKTEVTILR